MRAAVSSVTHVRGLNVTGLITTKFSNTHDTIIPHSGRHHKVLTCMLLLVHVSSSSQNMLRALISVSSIVLKIIF